MEQLTDRQKEILSFIRDYVLTHGYSPLIEDIKEHFQLSSVNGVIKHLKALERKGFLNRTSKARGIELTEDLPRPLPSPHASLFQIPLIGMIPAGNPTSLDAYTEDYIMVDHNVVDLQVKAKPNELFALRVKGDSMIDAGIYEGDVVICQRKEAKLYDIVVGLVDNENTLKRLVKRDGSFYLRAENHEYPDILPVEELVIQGVVISLIRHFS